MATNELVEHPARATGVRSRRISLEHHFCITAMKNVNADCQKVFHALTLPEYIETWRPTPGALIGRTAGCRRDGCLSFFLVRTDTESSAHSKSA
jgi:hypothetical protein